MAMFGQFPGGGVGGPRVGGGPMGPVGGPLPFQGGSPRPIGGPVIGPRMPVRRPGGKARPIGPARPTGRTNMVPLSGLRSM